MAFCACRKKSFDIFIEDYESDFLCLQEIKLNPDAIPEDDFGYSFRHYHLADKNGYSGTAILSKQEPLSVAEDFPTESMRGRGGQLPVNTKGSIW